MDLGGNYQHTLDSKMRLLLPADIRKDFAGKVVLLPLNKAVFGFTPEGYKAYIESLFPGGFNARDRKQDQFRRLLNGNKLTLEIDTAGRIPFGKVPQQARERLNLQGEVVVVGNGDHFEVWDPTAWSEYCAKLYGDFDDLMYGESA